MTDSDLSIKSLFSVKGKVAVVTGGGSGIGTMIASALVQNGAKVYIASRTESQLKEVADALNKRGPGTCYYIIADLSSQTGCEQLANAIKEREQKIHILVNCAGMAWGAAFEEFQEMEGWDYLMAVNVKSVFYSTKINLTPILQVTRALVDLLAKNSNNQDPARVINISSVAAFAPRVEGNMTAPDGYGTWSYAASKAAVNHLTTSLATTLIKKFITVNAICPGIFQSKMTAWAFETRGEEYITTGQPTGRLGTSEDIAGTILYLVSPASAHVNGVHIPVDGGKLISSGGPGPKL